jgi:hypothetical protein
MVTTPVAAAGGCRVELRGPQGDAHTSLEGYVAPAGPRGASTLRVRVPAWMPPGRYAGHAEIAGEQHALTVDVEPHVRLEIMPRRLVVEARPGDEVRERLTLLNGGNVVLHLRKHYSVGLFQHFAIGRAVGRAFQDETARGGRFVDRLADEIRAGYGGVLRLVIPAPDPPLAPGDAREIDVTLVLPDTLDPAHSYWGTWQAHRRSYAIDVHVNADETRREEPR